MWDISHGFASGIGVALARYNPNGSLDSTFDGDGKLTTAVTQGDAHSVVVQPDGQIVVAGIGNGHIALVRYLANGALDPTFDHDGQLFPSYAPNERAYALAFQPDGRLIEVGDHHLSRFFLDGALDRGGRQTLAFSQFKDNEQAFAAAAQPDGKLVLAGFVAQASDQFALARYTPDGRLDSTFDGDGRLTFGFGGDERARAVALQPDGKIVAVGSVSSPNAGDNLMLARFRTDGAFDCFNITDFNGGNDEGHAVAISPDQTIVVAGRVWSPSAGGYEIGVARYQSNCAIDRSFGSNGTTQVGFGSGDEDAQAVIVQPDGKIVLAGTVRDEIVLVRLTADGAQDLSFGSGGRVVTHIGLSDDAYALRRQADWQTDRWR